MIEAIRTQFGGGRLSRLHGRPRKLAALACLVLAGVSALNHGGSSTHSSAPHPQPGQVAIALTLSDGGAGREFLSAGQHIDLLSDTSDLKLSDVAVLSVAADSSTGGLMQSGSGKSDGTNLVVGVDAKDVAMVTAFATHPIFAALQSN